MTTPSEAALMCEVCGAVAEDHMLKAPFRRCRVWRAPTPSEATPPAKEPTMSKEEAAKHVISAVRKRQGCHVISNSGPNGEPLGCGYPGDHEGPHSWATLPTFTKESR